MILITTDETTANAVKATGANPTIHERIGQAAAAGNLHAAGLVLFDRAALATAAALGRLTIPATTAAVLTSEPTDEDWALIQLAEVDNVLVLPAAAGWLAQQA